MVAETASLCSYSSSRCSRNSTTSNCSSLRISLNHPHLIGSRMASKVQTVISGTIERVQPQSTWTDARHSEESISTGDGLNSRLTDCAIGWTPPKLQRSSPLPSDIHPESLKTGSGWHATRLVVALIQQEIGSDPYGKVQDGVCEARSQMVRAPRFMLMGLLVTNYPIPKWHVEWDTRSDQKASCDNLVVVTCFATPDPVCQNAPTRVEAYHLLRRDKLKMVDFATKLQLETVYKVELAPKYPPYWTFSWISARKLRVEIRRQFFRFPGV
jgi:hypothetical protein